MAGGAQGGGPGLAPPPQDGPKPPNLQHGVPPGPPGLNPAPGPPSHAPFGGYGSMNGKPCHSVNLSSEIMAAAFKLLSRKIKHMDTDPNGS